MNRKIQINCRNAKNCYKMRNMQLIKWFENCKNEGKLAAKWIKAL